MGRWPDSSRSTVVTALIMFLGFGLGQIIYGPISDSSGRKPPIYAGMAIYIIGGLVCITSASLMSMLFGRFLQGFGIAGPRIVMLARCVVASSATDTDATDLLAPATSTAPAAHAMEVVTSLLKNTSAVSPSAAPTVTEHPGGR